MLYGSGAVTAQLVDFGPFVRKHFVIVIFLINAVVYLIHLINGGG